MILTLFDIEILGFLLRGRSLLNQVVFERSLSYLCIVLWFRLVDRSHVLLEFGELLIGLLPPIAQLVMKFTGRIVLFNQSLVLIL